MIEQAGRVDISFNAVGIPDAKILGVPLVELDVEQFSLPITAYTTSYFLTARLAARRMVAEGIGRDHDRHRAPRADGHPLNGGYGPAQAAKEALTRPVRRARAAGHPRGRPATARAAGDGHDARGLRAQEGDRADLGGVPGVPRQH